MQKCFYDPVTNKIIDMASMRADGKFRSAFGHHTVDQLRFKHPGIMLMDIDAAARVHNSASILPVQQIQYDTFFSTLNSYSSPSAWVRMPEEESFKADEFLTGRIVTIYARVWNDYFVMRDDAALTHDIIIARCKSFLHSNAAEQAEQVEA